MKGENKEIPEIVKHFGWESERMIFKYREMNVDEADCILPKIRLQGCG